ncbi:MAG: flagellar basal body P-ring formation chaperone FlgA [Devosia sp.]
MHKLLLPALFSLLATAAHAAPVLKGEVTINRPIVTVGDMFDDAGLLAERGLFRAPAPGTTGIVSLDAVRAAARAVGLTDYDATNVLSVRVDRPAAVVDAAALTGLIEAELNNRGLMQPGVSLVARFDTTPDFKAEAVEAPAALSTLNYQPGASMFTARFTIAGVELPVDVSGRLDLMIEVPHLSTSLPAGSIIGPADVAMKPVSLAMADNTGVTAPTDLIGKQLRRNTREGVMLKLSDVAEPLVVKRNTQVTVLLRNGPMTLTVIGQSLGDAAAGQAVQVMNSVTRKVLNGVATQNGAIEITTAAAQLQVAGL